KAEEECQWHIEFALEPHHRVLQQVAEVDCVALFNHLRVLFAHEPAHVSKEKSTVGVVWIGVCLRVLVMHSMVTTPHVNVILQCHRVQQHQQYSQGQLGFISSMRPQAMRACGDAHSCRSCQ